MSDDQVICLERDGEFHVGVYTVNGEVVTVHYLGACPAKPEGRGNKSPRRAAEILLVRLISESAQRS